MSVTILAPTPTCVMTVTGYFQPNPPFGNSVGSCPNSGMDAGDQLIVGPHAPKSGASNSTVSDFYTGSAGQNITVAGSSNRMDEIIVYTVSCTGTCSIAAPVTLLYLNGTITSSSVVLDWATTNEINNDYFSVEYSNNGIDFKEVMIVKGAGTSTLTNLYSAEIKDRFVGTTYFRLKQHDFDGKVTVYSQIFSLTNNADNDFFIAQSEEGTMVNVNVYHETAFEMRVYDILGTTLVEKTAVNLPTGSHQLPMEVYASGMYICVIVLDNKTYSKKFIVY